MAVIDRDGLLYGDRLGKCSDSAQLWFPRYFASSNTCARFELNYEKLRTTVFASLKNPPTKQEFWNHMVDYNKNFLLFTYDVGGVIWGQWWTAEHFLQKYPLNADKRTPQAPDEPFQHWKDAYYKQKKESAAKPLDLNTYVINTDISKDFKKLSKISSGVGGGVGEGSGKAEAQSTAQPKAATDSRFQPIKKHVEKCCKHVNVPFVWEASEATHLSKWLKAAPNVPLETCIEYVKNRFRLAREPGERPRKWIGDLGKFATQQVSTHGQVTKAQRNEDSSRDAIKEALARRNPGLVAGEADGRDARALPESSPDRGHGTGLLDGLDGAGEEVRAEIVPAGARGGANGIRVLPIRHRDPQGD
jgi:hypothetical protein